MLTSTNPLAPNVASSFGVYCEHDINGVWHIGNGLSQKDFDDCLADLVSCGAKPIASTKDEAYDLLQSEGINEPVFIDRTPSHPQDY